MKEKIIESVCKACDGSVKMVDGSYEISFYSNAGENIVIDIPNGSVAGLVHDFYRAWQEFDADEHVEELLEAKRLGIGNIPDVATLAEDAVSIEKTFKSMANAARDVFREVA